MKIKWTIILQPDLLGWASSNRTLPFTYFFRISKWYRLRIWISFWNCIYIDIRLSLPSHNATDIDLKNVYSKVIVNNALQINLPLDFMLLSTDYDTLSPDNKPQLKAPGQMLPVSTEASPWDLRTLTIMPKLNNKIALSPMERTHSFTRSRSGKSLF